jgi:UDP-GlcNAc:undecaprenyl-phosphate/decaprenyl-phosphate GlcNAc-1-phosphate transferase
MYSIIFLAVTSFLISLAITPLLRQALGSLVDRPNEERKLHRLPIPRIGGIPIALAYVAAFGLLLLSPLHGASRVSLPLVLTLMPAALVVFATGLLDDLVGLTPWQKLLGEVTAAGLAYYCGVRIIGIAGYSAGWWSVPVTVIWLVACTNAFNLIDGVDGLATGVGLFATLTTFLAALLQKNTALALATVPMAGALLGFLRYNFNPASIFLGDCGSLSIGFLLGCCGVIWSQKSATLLGMAAPLMALSIPLLDTTLAIARRFLRHQPIFGADRNHIHHRLLDRGFSPRKVALLLYAMCGIAAAFSLLHSLLQKQVGGLMIVIFSVITWAGVRYLAYGEFATARRLTLQGTFRHILHAQLYLKKLEDKLARARTGDDCWTAIQQLGRDYEFSQLHMHLGGRLYNARFRDTTRDRSWTIHIPLSNSEYVELTHQRESSKPLNIALSSVAEILQRSLASRVDQFRPIREVPSNGFGHEASADCAKSLAASAS